MRASLFCVSLIGTLTAFGTLTAQTTAESDADLKRQVSALRDAVIQQTRQIDALTAEIERLGVALGQRRPPKATVPAGDVSPAATETPTVNTVNPGETPVPVVSTTPDPAFTQHTVVKGDNLTNLSKKYGTTVETIQKLNKITDARKMQVGQVLSIPTPTPAPAPSLASPSPTPKN